MRCNGQQRSNHAAPTRGRLLVEGLVVHGAGAIVIDLGGLFARGVTVTVTRGVLLLVPRLLLLLPRLLLLQFPPPAAAATTISSSCC